MTKHPNSCQTPASSWVWVLNTGVPKGLWISTLRISTKFQTDACPVLTLPGSRWLQILAPSSCRPSAHTSACQQGTARRAQEEGGKGQTWSSGGACGVRRHFLSAHTEPWAESAQIAAASPAWIQFSKRWSCSTCGRKGICCQLAWLDNYLFQPLAKQVHRTYYSDIIVRQFQIYPILWKGRGILLKRWFQQTKFVVNKKFLSAYSKPIANTHTHTYTQIRNSKKFYSFPDQEQVYTVFFLLQLKVSLTLSSDLCTRKTRNPRAQSWVIKPLHGLRGNGELPYFSLFAPKTQGFSKKVEARA